LTTLCHIAEIWNYFGIYAIGKACANLVIAVKRLKKMEGSETPMLEQHRLFAKLLAAGETPEQAAITAGYPAQHAKEIGDKLKKDPEVKSFMKNGCREMPPLPALPGASNVVPAAAKLKDPYLEEIEQKAIPSTGDPLLFLLKVMDHPMVPLNIRMDAAKSLMPFKYAKLGETGKKEQKQLDAESLAGDSTPNPYAPSKAPKPANKNIRAVQ
jgi:phage terminase small subunit